MEPEVVPAWPRCVSNRSTKPLIPLLDQHFCDSFGQTEGLEVHSVAAERAGHAEPGQCLALVRHHPGNQDRSFAGAIVYKGPQVRVALFPVAGHVSDRCFLRRFDLGHVRGGRAECSNYHRPKTLSPTENGVVPWPVAPTTPAKSAPRIDRHDDGSGTSVRAGKGPYGSEAVALIASLFTLELLPMK